jgi:hypothetical protein
VSVFCRVRYTTSHSLHCGTKQSVQYTGHFLQVNIATESYSKCGIHIESLLCILLSGIQNGVIFCCVGYRTESYSVVWDTEWSDILLCGIQNGVIYCCEEYTADS